MSRSSAPPTTRLEPPKRGTPWTTLHLIRWSTAYLEEKGVPAPRLDVEYLLAHVLDTERLQLYLEFDRPITPEELSAFKPLLLQRADRKPLQYILGRTTFRQLELVTDARVLIPRPETEELVGLVLERFTSLAPAAETALDVGTGSGAIALALAEEGAFQTVIGTDPSAEALQVASDNAHAHGLQHRVHFRLGEGFDPLDATEQCDAVVSNPPYVAPEEFEALDPEVRDWEPTLALLAEDRGLSIVRTIVYGAPAVVKAGGILALEVGDRQALPVADYIRETSAFEAPVVLRDAAGLERFVLATRLRGSA